MKYPLIVLVLMLVLPDIAYTDDLDLNAWPWVDTQPIVPTYEAPQVHRQPWVAGGAIIIDMSRGWGKDPVWRFPEQGENFITLRPGIPDTEVRPIVAPTTSLDGIY